MFSPDVQHQGNAQRHYPDWIIHQPRMLFFNRIASNNKHLSLLQRTGAG
jgi:hypothetical protein